MNKFILLSLITLITLFSLAMAKTEVLVTIDPAGLLPNNTYSPVNTVYLGYNVTGNTSLYDCYLWSNENGTSGTGDWREATSDTNKANNTNYYFTRNSVADNSGAVYKWMIRCNSTEGVSNWSSYSGVKVNYTYGVDTVDPSVTVNSPSTANVWFSNNKSVIVNLTVVDNNVASCILDTTMNITSPYTYGSYLRGFDTASYTNNTAFNFSRLNNTGKANLSDDSTGNYVWSYRCNDTAGRWVNSSNYTLYVDATLPSTFTFTTTEWLTDNERLIVNATTSTDYDPQIGWGTVTETNFSVYQILFYQDNLGNTTFVELNVSDRTTNTSNMSVLLGDKNYWINITAWDLAGNKRQMTNGYKYSTDSTGRTLKTGWNIIGNVGNSFNLSELLSWTGATTTSIWNSSHMFQSHVSGGSHGTVQVKSGDTALVYVGSNTNFSDLIWNTTWFTGFNMSDNITNTTTSDWNLVMNRNFSTSFNFRQLDNFSNLCENESACKFSNMSVFSLFNNSANVGYRSVPFVSNWTISNTTTFDFGQCIWIYTSQTAPSPFLINWSIIGGY